MAEERGYQSQVGPGGPAPMVERSAASFGAGVGAAIADAGATLHQAKLRSYKLDRQEKADSEAADFTAKFTKLRTDMDVATREARSNSGAGAKGHSEAITKNLQVQRDALLGGITEDSVRRAAIAQFDEYSLKVAKSEGDFEEGRRVDKLVTDIGSALDMGRNRIRVSKGDADIYSEELTQQVAAIYALQNVPQDVKDGLAKDAEQKLSVGFIQGMMDDRPDEAKAAMMAGQFNDVLSSEQLDALMNGADVEIRRRDAAAEREAAAAKSALGERVATVKAMDEQGIEVPEETLAELEAASVLVGDTSTAVQLQGIRANNAFARVYDKATPLQIEQRTAALQAKDKPSAAEQRELQWLEQKGGALTTKFQNDPFASAQASTGQPAPPLDFANPASISARMAWQRTASAATGRPIPMLSKAELSGLQQQYQTGEAGQAQLHAQLDMVPSVGGARAAVAREIAPDDRPFQIRAQLAPGVRRMANEGLKVLREKKGFFVPSKDNQSRDDIHDMVEQVNTELAYAMRNFPGEAASIQNVGVQIAAGGLAGRGQDGDNLNEATYRGGINHALGRVNGLGGLGKWNGKPFIIADGFTPGGFEAAIMRDLRRNVERPRGQANPPVNPDGTTFDLKKATPVWIGTDEKGRSRYQWEVGSGASATIVKAKNGAAYVSEVVAGG
jgi:hypothetical protein